MPIVISNNETLDYYNLDRMEVMRILLSTFVDLANEELGASNSTELGKVRRKMLKSLILGIDKTLDTYIPQIEDAEKTDRIKRLFNC